MRAKNLYVILGIVTCVGVAFLSQGYQQADREPATGGTSQGQSSHVTEPEELPRDTAELNGYLTEGMIPEGFQYKDRLYIGGENNYCLIDMDDNLVRWGTNWDNWDVGWEQENGAAQPFRLRNVLVQHATKYTRGFSASFVLDQNHDLWAWGISPWLLLDGDTPPSNEPRRIMSSVKDIATSDFDAAAVLEDGTLKIWGSEEGRREPVTIQNSAEKVYFMWAGFFYIDMAGNLYDDSAVWSDEVEGSPEVDKDPILLDTNVEDIQDLQSGAMLVLKKDGTVGLLDHHAEPYTFSPLAEHVQAINDSGFISANGDYWHVITESGKYVRMEKEENSAYAVYNFNGDSIRILNDGKIEMRFNEET